jgi:hypothetical protein
MSGELIGGGVGAGLDCLTTDNAYIGTKVPRLYMLPDVQNMMPRYRDDCSVYSFQTGFWPGTTGPMTDAGGLSGDISNGIWWDYPDVVTGHIFRYGFVGITRDQYGSPLGGVSLRLFRTVDDTLQDSQTSASDGSYVLGTPFLDAHYVVSQKAGPPPVAGATVNTLIAST